jgi:hypothetical protein
MKTKSAVCSLLLPLFFQVWLAPVAPASIRFSSGVNAFEGRATLGTSSGWALPEGDWTIGIWDNNFQGDGGSLFNGVGAANKPGTINLAYDAATGRYRVGGLDESGNPFGSGGTILNGDMAGALPDGYPGRVSGKFTPRLHIIRRQAGRSEYLVAEAGHAPVLVSSEACVFGKTRVGHWGIGCRNGWAALYDGDLEGFFFANGAVSDQDIALMAAGCKPSSVSSLAGKLAVYFPMETADLEDAANPVLMANLGSDASVGLKRLGAVTRFADGPMLRGAVLENGTPAEIFEPTNVVALHGFQPFQIIRHVYGSADVTFTGFDYGAGPADIEIRFVDGEHGTVTPWQVLVANSAGGGAGVQATIPVPKGYWKTMEVRRVNSAGGGGNSNRPNRTWSRWAVGEVVAVWGDSIQGQVQGATRADRVAPNGFTAKYPSAYPNGFKGDKNPLSSGMWNLLRGGGMGGGSQGENEIANALSAASKCCVGITVSWAGATRLAAWNGRLGSEPYETAKTYATANGGLNKPNVITWVGNLASAKYGDDFYSDLDLFKAALDRDFGAGTWKLILAPMPVVYDGSGGSAEAFHKLRDACQRWVRDNPEVGAFAGVFLDHTTTDGVHPTGDAWDIMGPRWGNAAGYLRDQKAFADPRAGEITGFHRDSGNLLVKVHLFAGTALTVKNAESDISGLSLSADNFASSIPLSSARLIDGSTVRITPAEALPAGPLKLRYLYGRPGFSGATPAQQGVDNLLYVNAGPANLLAIQPIWGAAASNWSLEENVAPPPVSKHARP